MPDPAALHATDIRQSKEPEPDGQGGLHDVWTIRFKSPSGTPTHVKIPASSYSPENVAALMHHELQQIEGVHGLEGQPLPPAAEAG